MPNHVPLPLAPPPSCCRSDGRIGTNMVANLGKMFGLSVDPWVKALKGTQFAAADRQELIGVFNYLEFCLKQVVQDNELGALREVRPPAPPDLSFSCWRAGRQAKGVLAS